MNGKVFHHILQRLRPGEGDIYKIVGQGDLVNPRRMRERGLQ